MKKLIFVFFVLGSSLSVFSQQLQQYSQYVLNNYALNPAIGGSESAFIASSNNRYQWVGVTDAPRTSIFTLHGPLKNQKMGVGGMLYYDVAGPQRRTGVNFSYSYHLTLNEELKLSFGVSAGILQYATDFGKIKFNNTQDPAVTSNFSYVLLPDATAGLYLYSEKLFVSISAPQLIPFKVQYFDDYGATQNKLVNHFFASAGYKQAIGESITIQPSVLVKYVNPITPQIEGTLRGIYKDMVWVGGSYRTQDAIAILAGFTLQENITLAYSYDLINSSIKNYSTGTHELMIGIRFKSRK